MSDLRGWLRAHHLEQLAEAFEANDIDVDILSELTEEDLEKLGVSLGNRRRLLKAIAEGGEIARSVETRRDRSARGPCFARNRRRRAPSGHGAVL